ncbi:hypothetical protein [Ekhidna sp.]
MRNFNNTSERGRTTFDFESNKIGDLDLEKVMKTHIDPNRRGAHYSIPIKSEVSGTKEYLVLEPTNDGYVGYIQHFEFEFSLFSLSTFTGTHQILDLNRNIQSSSYYENGEEVTHVNANGRTDSDDNTLSLPDCCDCGYIWLDGGPIDSDGDGLNDGNAAVRAWHCDCGDAHCRGGGGNTGGPTLGGGGGLGTPLPERPERTGGGSSGGSGGTIGVADDCGTGGIGGANGNCIEIVSLDEDQESFPKISYDDSSDSRKAAQIMNYLRYCKKNNINGNTRSIFSDLPNTVYDRFSAIIKIGGKNISITYTEIMIDSDLSTFKSTMYDYTHQFLKRGVLHRNIEYAVDCNGCSHPARSILIQVKESDFSVVFDFLNGN